MESKRHYIHKKKITINLDKYLYIFLFEKKKCNCFLLENCIACIFKMYTLSECIYII